MESAQIDLAVFVALLVPKERKLNNHLTPCIVYLLHYYGTCDRWMEVKTIRTKNNSLGFGMGDCNLLIQVSFAILKKNDFRDFGR